MKLTSSGSTRQPRTFTPQRRLRPRSVPYKCPNDKPPDANVFGLPRQGAARWSGRSGGSDSPGGFILKGVVREVRADHRGAADRHETATETHERAARFWDDQGDAGRAELQREMAEFERRGASLERRWAELADWDGVPRPRPVGGGRARDQTERGAKQLSEVLTRMADAPERAARLAEQHAARCDQAGRGDDAASEREAAERARKAARRARAQAKQWRDTSTRQEG